VADGSSDPASADYRYDRFDDGSGDFQFAAHANLVGGPALEDGTVRSRWNAAGAGRGDARVTGGDAAGGMTVSECWDASFQRVYFAADPAVVAVEGQASACVYADALLPSL
jgi:hypothetical protein